MYQLRNSMASCIHEINRVTPTETGIEARWIILNDYYCQLLGVVILSSLAYFLALGAFNGELKLDGWLYVLSSALVPICVGLYFNSAQAGCRGEVEVEVDVAATDADDKRHRFPTVILWHTMLTGAYWFMKSGMRDCEEAVKACAQTIKEVERLDEKIAPRTKSKD